MDWPFLLVAAYAAIATVPLVRTDIREHRLPNRWTYPGWAVAIVALAVEAVAVAGVPWAGLGTGAAAGLIFLVLALVAGMGLGDAKLAVPLAVGLGLRSPGHAVFGLITALALGGIAAMAVLVVRRRAGQQIPFGPWLFAGFWTAALA